MKGILCISTIFASTAAVFAVDADATWATSIMVVALILAGLSAGKIWLDSERERNDERCSLYRSIHR